MAAVLGLSWHARLRTWFIVTLSVWMATARVVSAAEQCTQYRVVGTGAFSGINSEWITGTDNGAAACSAFAGMATAALNATQQALSNGGRYNYYTYALSGQVSSSNCSLSGTATLTCGTDNPSCSGGGQTSQVSPGGGSIQSRMVECEPEDCDQAQAGTVFSSTGSGTSVPAEVCDGPSKCKAVAVGVGAAMGGTWVGTYKLTTESCSGGTTLPKGNEQCVTVGAVEYCSTTAGDGQCGYINDQMICLKKTPDKGCLRMGDGSKVCRTDASTPPAPDTGVPGTKAAADETLSTREAAATGTGSVTNNYHYYSAATVAGSSRGDVGGGGDPEGPPGEGQTDDEGNSASGGVTCDAPPTCDGNAIMCAILEQQWRNRCPDVVPEEQLLQEVGLDPDAKLPGADDEPVNVVEDFDSTGWLGSRSCIADQVISMGSYGTITVPLADKCWFFQLIGNLVLIGAWLSAARIVFTGGN